MVDLYVEERRGPGGEILCSDFKENLPCKRCQACRGRGIKCIRRGRIVGMISRSPAPSPPSTCMPRHPDDTGKCLARYVSFP